MKILHVLTSPRAEGTPRLVLDWLTVQEQEQEILFLSAEGELKTEFEQTGVWQFYNAQFQLRFTSAIEIVKLVKKVCEERKPEIVISWPMGFSQWIHLGARLAGVKKLLVHAGNPPGHSWMSKYAYTYLSFWIGFLLGNKVVACSDYIRDAFRTIPLLSKKQFHSVYNCVRIEKFKMTIAKEPHQAIMVATLERHKDHVSLLNAWKILEERKMNFELLLAGNGSMREELQQIAEQLKLKQVRFLGSRNDVPLLLNKSKVFILSTTSQEGFGTVLIEALAARCQVIATDVPACREVLRDGEYGELFPPRDPHALADLIEKKIMTDPDEKLMAHQQQYASTFSPRKMIKNYINIFGNGK